MLQTVNALTCRRSIFFIWKLAGLDIAPRISACGESASVRFERAFGSLRLMGKARRRFACVLGGNATRAEIFCYKNFCCMARKIILTQFSGRACGGAGRPPFSGIGAGREAVLRICGFGAAFRAGRCAARVRIFFRYFRFLSFAPRRGFAMILQVIRACARGKQGGNL